MLHRFLNFQLASAKQHSRYSAVLHLCQQEAYECPLVPDSESNTAAALRYSQLRFDTIEHKSIQWSVIETAW